MSLRTRLTLAGGGAVFVALAIASSVIYFEVRSRLHDQIDFSLIQSADSVAVKSHGVTLKSDSNHSPACLGKDASGLFQVIPARRRCRGWRAVGDRSACADRRDNDSAELDQRLAPSAVRQIVGHDDSVARAVAPVLQGRSHGGHGVAVCTRCDCLLRRTDLCATHASADRGERNDRPRAPTAARPDARRGARGGAPGGGLAANAVLRPVRALAGTVRKVSATRDLNQRIPVSGRDELASLAADFNAMLAALDELATGSTAVDRGRLARAADAADRAPRPNVELLARLGPARRTAPTGARRSRPRGSRSSRRWSAISSRPARDGRSVDARELLRVRRACGRSGRSGAAQGVGACASRAVWSRTRLSGPRSRLERAVDNVLDNAIKWSPPGSTVDVRLAGGRLTVRDHGPGIPEADLPHVFDRFYRAADGSRPARLGTPDSRSSSRLSTTTGAA